MKHIHQIAIKHPTYLVLNRRKLDNNQPKLTYPHELKHPHLIDKKFTNNTPPLDTII
jgi:hypothetical protein